MGNGLEASHCPIYEGPATIQWAKDRALSILSQPEIPTGLVVANSPAMIGGLLPSVS